MEGNSLLIFIIIGLIAGVCASYLMRSGGSLLFDVIVGMVGALLGGWLSSQLGGPSVSGFNLISIIVAIIGACILIWLLRMFQSRRSI